ncbi:uncharacterized protein EKO05_0005456 [Ascochyta rabiei]|uniref:uncharacterized protein n=1 Tax=Didymella rabiei TaxID=5454 RepID=UPI00190155B9|nr:uncharacterized protein EKO05_0005456 [Ascochyta rabiei]UPX14988.1 hypothetical protein EKO05_0005456 [Ascochyta rabiei]
MPSTFDIETYKGNIINNEIVSTPKTRYSINPTTGKALYEVPVARKEDGFQVMECYFILRARNTASQIYRPDRVTP